MDAYQFLRKYGRDKLDMIADQAGYGRETLYFVALGHRNASVKAAVRISEASGGRIDRFALMTARMLREHRREKSTNEQS